MSRHDIGTDGASERAPTADRTGRETEAPARVNADLAAFRSEIADRFGLLPNFLLSQSEPPSAMAHLWAFAKSAWLDSPLPALFKERLFVHLSRYCEMRYSIVRHVGFLMNAGRVARDAASPPLTFDEVVELVARPAPDVGELDEMLGALEREPASEELPPPGSPEEARLFHVLTGIFLAPNEGRRAQEAVRRLVGKRNFELLAAFLTFVRAAHFWTETHPELDFEPDVALLMDRHPALAALLLNATEAAAASPTARLTRALGELDRAEDALSENKTVLAAQREALEAALNGAPLEASLNVLVRAAMRNYAREETRAAFYLADHESGGLYHVVGMPPDYAAAVNGFRIGSESFACGLATHTGEPVITEDVQLEPRWTPWRATAERFDFRGCWSFPIHTRKGALVGTFALYWRRPRKASERDIELARLLSQSAGIIIARDKEAALRRKAEEQLRASERRFRQFAEASSGALWIRDAKTLDLEYASPALGRIHGVTAEAMLGDIRFWAASIVPEDRDAALGEIERARNGDAVVHEFRIHRSSDGIFRWIRNTVFPLFDGEGLVERIGGIAEDVTETKLAVEHQAVLVAELQHRVRNIMAIIRAVVARTAERAESPADYAERIAGRLLALSRVQALLTQSAAGGVSLAAILRDELGAYTPEAEQVRLDGPDVALSPKAAEVLTLAVHELAANAQKYGALSVSEGRIFVRWRTLDKSGVAWLSFDWTEMGRARTPSSEGRPPRRGFGTELIEARVPYEIGGTGRVTIEEDGARCHIEFPLTEAASVLETGAPQRATVFGGALDMRSEPDLGGHRIMVVEDEYYIASDTARALQGAGAGEVDLCPTEEAARAELERRRPDAVVLDINLGPGPSFDLAGDLRQRAIPFIFVTGYGRDAIPAEFGDVIRLPKPVQPREIIGAIARLLEAAR